MVMGNLSNGNASSQQFLRSRYFPRQVVTAADLTADQIYEQQLWQLHNRYLLGCGVVCGLEVFYPPSEADNGILKVIVTPGYAISPQGDSIFVPTEQTVTIDCSPNPTDLCENPNAVIGEQQLYLAIRYREIETCPIPALPERCAPNTTCEFSRIQVSFKICCLNYLPPTCQRPAIDCYTVVGEVIQGQHQHPASREEIPPVFTCPSETPEPWVVLATIQIGADGRTSLSYGDRAQLTPTRFLKEILRCLPGQRDRPLITSIEPDTGQPGTALLALIRGQGLAGTTAVNFLEPGITARLLQPGEPIAQFNTGYSYGQRIAFSPDGQLLATTGYSTVQIWEAATGRQIALLQHSYFVNWIAFSPNGQVFATSTSDGNEGSVRLWATMTGREIVRMGRGYFSSGSFTPDGQYLIGNGYDNTVQSYVVQVWDARTGAAVAVIVSNPSFINQVTLSPDGQYLFALEANNIARVWLVPTGELVAHLNHQLNQMFHIDRVAFSADGAYFVTKAYSNTNQRSTVQVWVASTGELMARMDYGYYLDQIRLSPDGQYLAIAGFNGTARNYIVQVLTLTGEEISRINTGESYIQEAIFSPSGFYLATRQYNASTQNGIVQLWRVTTGVEITQINITDPIQGIAFSPDEAYLGVTTSNSVRIYRVTTGIETARINHGSLSFIQQFLFNSDGTYLATAGFDTGGIWVGVASSDTQIPVQLRIEQDARPTRYAFQIVTPKGIADSRDFDVAFQVVAAIARISPSRGRQGETLIASILGRGLGSATAVNFSGTGITARILSGGTHAIVRVQLTIARDAPSGSQTFQVMTPDGVVDSAMFGVEFVVRSLYGYPYGAYGFGRFNPGIGGNLL